MTQTVGIPCPACNDREWLFVADEMELSRTNYPERERVTYWACRGCGLVRKEPLPSSEELQKHYTTTWQFSTSRPEVCFRTAADWIEKETKRSRMFGAPFDIHTPWSPRKACDVGSKGSALADCLHRAEVLAKWESFDPHPTQPGIASGWLGDGIQTSMSFDLVTTTHVMEHVRDPLQFVKDLLGMLTPQGFGYIEVPSLELHADDPGSCDDINRDHLYHFTTHSLFSLVQRAGGIIKAHLADPVPRWPVHRLLISRPEYAKDASQWNWIKSSREIWSEYQKASNLLWLADNTESCLYGASHSYAYLHEYFPHRICRLRIFDLYRHGARFGNNVVEHPEALASSGIKKAYITSRFWNAFQDISTYIRKNYPGVEPLTPFENMEHF